jgi:hypothetical protein
MLLKGENAVQASQQGPLQATPSVPAAQAAEACAAEQQQQPGGSAADLQSPEGRAGIPQRPPPQPRMQAHAERATPPQLLLQSARAFCADRLRALGQERPLPPEGGGSAITSSH